MTTDTQSSGTARTGITVAACVLVVVLSLWDSAHKSAWTDEIYSWWTSHGSLAYTFARGRDYELQPPLYFLLLNVWRHLWLWGPGQGEIMFMRFLSTIAAVACVWTMGAVGQWLKIERGLSPAVLVALSPGLIWAASEARGYALALALTAATLHFFLRLIGTDEEREPPFSPRDLVLYIVLSYLLIMTVYYGGFVLLGQWLGALYVRRWRRVSLGLGICAVGLAPWIPTILWQLRNHPNETPVFVAVPQAVFGVAQLYLSAFLRDTPLLDWPHITIILLVPAVIMGVIRIARGHLLIDERAVQVAAVVPLIALGALRVANFAPVQPRYVLITLPTLLALVSLWTDRPQRAVIRRVIGAWVAIVLVAGLAVLQDVGLEVADWRGATRVLTGKRAGAADAVLVAPSQDALALAYYYHGPGTVGGLPSDFSMAVYQPLSYRITDTTAVASRLATANAGDGAWILTATGPSRLSPQAHHTIRDVLRRHYCQVDTTALAGVTVLHATRSGC
jgi:hypothetical protein